MTRIEERTAAELGEDRFVLWPIALVCSFPLFLIVLWTGPFVLAFAGAPLLFTVWIFLFLITLVMVGLSARARRWRHALSLLVLPIATLIAIANADPLWGFVIEAGERFHFQAMRRSYLEDISKLPS